MTRSRLRASLIFNLLIFALALAATLMMFTGFDLMGKNLTLTATRLEAFKFFTVDSNVFAGIASLLIAICEIGALRRGEYRIPVWARTLKLCAATAVAVTFLVTAGFLGFLVEDYFSLYLNANFFFHFLIPVLCAVSFLCFEQSIPPLSIRAALCGVLPTALYAVYYGINVFSHAENGRVSPRYDWYYFVQGGVWQIWIVLPVMLLFSYLIALAFWGINRARKL